MVAPTGVCNSCANPVGVGALDDPLCSVRGHLIHRKRDVSRRETHWERLRSRPRLPQ